MTATSRGLHSNDVFAIETVHLDRLRAHVRVAGELDIATVPTLESVLRGHLEAGRRLLRLDMSAVDFVDAGALSVIAVLHHEALARRGTLVLGGVTARVARVLALVDLDKVLFIGGPRSDHDVEVGEPATALISALVFPSRLVHPARGRGR